MHASFFQMAKNSLFCNIKVKYLKIGTFWGVFGGHGKMSLVAISEWPNDQ
jgi:hypothetical protein